MSDDWRLQVILGSEDSARELTDRLGDSDLAHDLSVAFHERVVVSRDDAVVFCYAETREQLDATRRAIDALAAEHDWQLNYQLRRWHPTAEEWEDPDAPLPSSPEEIGAERAELMGTEQAESKAQGFPEFEVRVKCPSHHDARQLAKRLAAEGIPSVHRWEFVVLGAADEDTANALAERVRAEAPAGSTVTAEGSVGEVSSEAPYATPYSPFAVFGGLGG